MVLSGVEDNGNVILGLSERLKAIESKETETSSQISKLKDEINGLRFGLTTSNSETAKCTLSPNIFNIFDKGSKVTKPEQNPAQIHVDLGLNHTVSVLNVEVDNSSSEEADFDCTDKENDQTPSFSLHYEEFPEIQNKWQTIKPKRRKNRPTEVAVNGKVVTKDQASSDPANSGRPLVPTGNKNKGGFPSANEDKGRYQGISSNSGFQKPRKNTQSKNMIVGTGGSNSKLTAVKKAWLYLGKIRKNTTTNDVSNYLSETFPGLEITVEKLESRGPNCSFRLGTSFDNKDTLMDGSKWPANSIIKRFLFHRRIEVQPT